MKKEIIFLFSIMLFLSSVASATNITVQDRTAKVNQQFLVNITCKPSEPIKSYEMKIHFDPRILSATSLSTGNFFKDRKTFSSPNCVINNTDGTIINIYDLTLGKGNMVTSSGVLFSIHFTAKANGTSTIEITDAGVTNDTRYLPLTITNGTVTIKGLYESGQTYLTYKAGDTEETGFMGGLTDIIIVMVIGAIIFFIFAKMTL